jgi:choline dehydrogenase-like flavoprotein
MDILSSLDSTFGRVAAKVQGLRPEAVLAQAFFLSDSQWEKVRGEGRFDLIIVGTGVCGLALAARMLLHDSHVRILMIERGPFFLPQHLQSLVAPYQHTLRQLLEAFPWTVATADSGHSRAERWWLHGMVPFFGGRSILWSGWCPRPTKEEMVHWPPQVVAAAQRHFCEAEAMLNVVPANRIQAHLISARDPFLAKSGPLYGTLQLSLQEMLSENLDQVPSATRCMPAPMSVGAGMSRGLDFLKFSVPGPLLDLVHNQAALAKMKAGSPLRIVTDCVATRILQQRGRAVALETTRGVINVGDAKLVLAMGTLPSTTLVLNSLPMVFRAGSRFTAHFVTLLVARVPRSDFSFAAELGDPELAALYMSGASATTGMQFHVQLSVLYDRHPEIHMQRVAPYVPDADATASPAQLAGSQEHLVFVAAALGELDFDNPSNCVRRNTGSDPEANVTLQVSVTDKDMSTWDLMDEAAFRMLELALSPSGPGRVEYWHGDAEIGRWGRQRPPVAQRRSRGLVHEASTMWIGADDDGVVGLDYSLRGTENVHIAGGSLWPAAGSWNPTLTMVALAHDLADQLHEAN